MSKTYQKNARRAESGSSAAGHDALVVPEQALMSLTESAESAREGLFGASVGVGLQVMHAIMEDDVTALCGPRA